MVNISKRKKINDTLVDKLKVYAVADALVQLRKTTAVKFDESIDVSVHVNIDPKKQNVRGVVSLPHGTGKDIRVAVFAKGDNAEKAEKAGAEFVGGEDLMEKIKSGFTDFDRCIASPDMMPLVGKVGKILGPKGLMPNPKLGTVTPDVDKAVKLAKSGQVEFKNEKEGIIHSAIGKVSFKNEHIMENIKAMVSAISGLKPEDAKGSFLKKIWIGSTMGPSFQLNIGDYI